MEAIYFVFRGRVQGVFFRATAKELADELGLKGFVHNLPNGDVELLVHGSRDKITKLEERLISSFLCHVAKKEAKTFSDSFTHFEVR